ncbi:MAG: hypothetical protein BMS9Abin12_1246 [Acidimicrobiia bacterium]|nr:MAG: hypothetical protein BMS9Abin12_1246 [Acidimicrobiia bacterium]
MGTTDDMPDTAGSEPPEGSGGLRVENEIIAALVQPFDAVDVEERSYASSATTYHAITIPVADWVAFARNARDTGFDTFIDLFAVDHFRDAPRFEVTLNLISMSARERILISTRVPYDDPSVPTLTGVFAGANFYEREAYDLVGIDFPGHPDLTRILMPDDWVGHPLRKDYDIGAVPVQFKAGSSDL